MTPPCSSKMEGGLIIITEAILDEYSKNRTVEKTRLHVADRYRLVWSEHVLAGTMYLSAN